MFHTASLSRPLQKGYVQCTACEHWCAVAPGQTAKCGVSRNRDGALRLVVYGHAITTYEDVAQDKTRPLTRPKTHYHASFFCKLDCYSER